MVRHGDREMEMTVRGALRVDTWDGRGGNVYLVTCALASLRGRRP